MDAAGYCRILGRLKDMIIRGGENIYPREIEELLCRHPGVADAAVVGVPDAVWGEIPVAFVRPAGPRLSEQELFDFCRQHLAPYKTPRHWHFVARFPQTASGKVQKFVLREMFHSDGDGSDTESKPIPRPSSAQHDAKGLREAVGDGQPSLTGILWMGQHLRDYLSKESRKCRRERNVPSKALRDAEASAAMLGPETNAAVEVRLEVLAIAI
jgi:hypothetical protein